jgi:RNA polymerase sigma-70 factor (ECF subfamily)
MACYSTYTDQQLSAFLKSGDERAFAEIYERYWSVLFLYVRNMLRDNEEAKDIVQEVFATLWMKTDQLDPDNCLSSYLYCYTRHKAIDHIRRDKVKGDYMQALSALIQEEPLMPDAAIREQQLAAIIEAAIGDLPAKMREVFELSRKSHLPYKEIAEQLGISEHTVKRQVSNALQILKMKVGLSMVMFIHLLK